MKKQVVVYKRLPQPELARLAGWFDLTRFDSIDEHNRGAFLAAIQWAHGLIGASVKLTNEMLSCADRLEAISTISVGYDNFDVRFLTERGIVLTNTPGVLTESVADAIFALMLAVARRVVELAEFVKAGRWKGSIGPSLYGVDVHSKTIGIIGMGRIGLAVARRACLGFNMPVLYYNRHRNAQAESLFEARKCGLDEVLAGADFVCVILPLTPETERFIGEREFNLMKPEAFFINGSRGKIVDEGALVRALQSRRIRGAGLDVFEKEPLSAESPLLTMPNVVALPHLGSATHETRLAMIRCAVENLIAVLNGGSSENTVNPEALDRRHSGGSGAKGASDKICD